MCNIYLKELRALSRGFISLNNERPPTYHARHPHDRSERFPWVLTYEFEYLQSASVPFSCFYNNTDQYLYELLLLLLLLCCCCCCCCCQYKLSAGSRMKEIVNTASSTSNISSIIYLNELRALSGGLISLNNELAPTYRACHPDGPSSSFPWVPTYGVEYLQGASAPFSCFYNNTSTDTNCCCCCCCCQYKLSAGSRKELIVNTAGIYCTSSISSNIYFKRTSWPEQGFDVSKQRVGTHLQRASPT